jgi:hypothetical protein
MVTDNAMSVQAVTFCILRFAPVPGRSQVNDEKDYDKQLLRLLEPQILQESTLNSYSWACHAGFSVQCQFSRPWIPHLSSTTNHLNSVA